MIFGRYGNPQSHEVSNWGGFWRVIAFICSNNKRSSFLIYFNDITPQQISPSSHEKRPTSGRANTPTELLNRAPQVVSPDIIPEGLDKRFCGTALQDTPDDTSKPPLERGAGHLRRTEGITDIALYNMGRESCYRRMVIDTSSRVNIMADQVCRDLGIEMKDEYNGPSIRISGLRKLQPKGLVEACWHFRDHTKVYRALFLVIETDKFDTFLGKKFVNQHQICEKHGIWRRLKTMRLCHLL